MKITINFGFIRGIINLFKNRKNRQQFGSSYVADEPMGKTEEQFVNFVKSVFGAEYQIAENYAVTNIEPTVTEARPYTMAFFRDGRLVLTILFTRHNGEKNRYFLNAKGVSLNRGIPCLNFFEHFPNEDEYIVNRIRECL